MPWFADVATLPQRLLPAIAWRFGCPPHLVASLGFWTMPTPRFAAYRARYAILVGTVHVAFNSPVGVFYRGRGLCCCCTVHRLPTLPLAMILPDSGGCTTTFGLVTVLTLPRLGPWTTTCRLPPTQLHRSTAPSRYAAVT